MKVHQIRRFSCLVTVKLQLNVPKSHKFGFRDNVSENRRFLVFNLNVLPGDECFSNFAIKCMRIGILTSRHCIIPIKMLFFPKLTKFAIKCWTMLCWAVFLHYDHILPDVV